MKDKKEKVQMKNSNNIKWIIFVASFILVLIILSIVSITLNAKETTEVSTQEKMLENKLNEELPEENIIQEEMDLTNLTEVADKSEEELKEINEKEVEENKKKEEEEKKENKDKKNTQKPKNKYYIKVNYGAQVVNVYTYDNDGKYTVPVKAFVCSTGTETPRSGVYKIPAKITWCHMFGDVWAHYCSQIVGNILFHSVPYLEKNNHTLEYWAYDKLGTKASMGCIRLTTRDAKWIYDNVSTGTSVEFYSSSNPGPLGKPSAQKISNAPGNLKWWDPTDPDSNNPWKNYKPSNNNNTNSNTNNSNTNTNTNNNTSSNTNTNTTNRNEQSGNNQKPSENQNNMDNNHTGNNEQNNNQAGTNNTQNTNENTSSNTNMNNNSANTNSNKNEQTQNNNTTNNEKNNQSENQNNVTDKNTQPNEMVNEQKKGGN